MTGGEILGLISIGVTGLLGLGVFLNSRRANQAGDKKLTLEEQIASDANDDRIAERRLVELKRLYEQVDELIIAKDEQHRRIEALELGRDEDRIRMGEMDSHISDLEALIPNPPGPPPRPWLARSTLLRPQ